MAWPGSARSDYIFDSHLLREEAAKPALARPFCRVYAMLITAEAGCSSLTPLLSPTFGELDEMLDKAKFYTILQRSFRDNDMFMVKLTTYVYGPVAECGCLLFVCDV